MYVCERMGNREGKGKTNERRGREERERERERERATVRSYPNMSTLLIQLRISSAYTTIINSLTLH